MDTYIRICMAKDFLKLEIVLSFNATGIFLIFQITMKCDVVQP